MTPRPPTSTSHRIPSRHSTCPKDNGATQAIPQQQPTPTDHLDCCPTKHTEKAVSRRLHRKQAAVYIGTSLSWLDKSRLRGDGPAFLQVGGRVIYDVRDLDAFLASCRRQSTSEPR